MSTENNQNKALNKTDVKCRFFMQYYGQEVFAFDNEDAIRINSKTISYVGQDCFLRLNKIEKISQEELLYIAKNIFERDEKSIDAWEIDYEEITFDFIDLLNGNVTDIFEDIKISSIAHLYDFLRSKGYAVPFMEYSVDELVKMGWLQLV